VRVQQGRRLWIPQGLRVPHRPRGDVIRRLTTAALLAVLAVTAGCSTSRPQRADNTPSPTAPSATASATATASGSPTSEPAYYHQKLSWHDCGSGLQCSTLKVPLDYAVASSRLIDVAVIRKPASDPSHRIGSLLINPGGPGGSGIDYVRCCANQFSALTGRFDLVSFDPRGVGESTPVRCLTSRELDQYVAEDPTPDTPAERAALIDSSKRFAAACWARNKDYLRHVGTIDQARDMDVLRAVLGDKKLTYLGKSYGTYLGAKYAQLFPTRIRALVLDGALDPSESTEQSNRVQARGFEVDLRDFIADCVRSGSCPLGTSTAAATDRLKRLIAQVDAHPLPAGGRTLGPGELFLGLAAGLYSTDAWPALRIAISQALNGEGRAMLYFTDSITERRPDGSYSNLIESNTAINCIDRPSSHNVATYDADARTFGKESPFFGAAIAYGTLTCAFWPVPPVEQAHAVRAEGAPPILVVGTTRDPATPYVWAQALAKQLASGVLLTYDGDGHTAYGRGDQCVDGAVNRYLLEGKPPANGTRCA
jgi:pimeloyl-ACP methyl ester carboxylesterase